MGEGRDIEALARLRVIEAKALHAQSKKPDSELVSDVLWLVAELEAERAKNEKLRSYRPERVAATPTPPTTGQFVPPEVEVRQHLAKREPSGTPFARYVECEGGCGWLIGVGDAVDTAIHESCAARGSVVLSQPPTPPDEQVAWITSTGQLVRLQGYDDIWGNAAGWTPLFKRAAVPVSYPSEEAEPTDEAVLLRGMLSEWADAAEQHFHDYPIRPASVTQQHEDDRVWRRIKRTRELLASVGSVSSPPKTGENK